MKNPKNFLVIDDHDVVIVAIGMVISQTYRDAVLHKATNFKKGLSIVGKGQLYDLIILDIDIPNGESSRMIKLLRDRQPGVRIIMFSGMEEQQHAIKFLSAGANGFLSKQAPIEQLKVAIRTVLADKIYMSLEVQQVITNHYLQKEVRPKTESRSLSPREKEVLDLLMKGKQSREIALELKLKNSTVGTHKARIFDKMEVSNIIELFKKIKDRPQ